MLANKPADNRENGKVHTKSRVVFEAIASIRIRQLGAQLATQAQY